MQETPLHIAARVTEGGEKCVQMLLKSGCDANINRADGVRPLHVAASEGHFGVVRLLLADGADPLLVNINGETPLQVACGTSHPGTLSVVQLLLEHVQAGSGSAATYVNTRNSIGETSLHAASNQPRITTTAKGKYPDRDIAQSLLQAGGDVSLDTYQVNSLILTPEKIKNVITFQSYFGLRRKRIHCTTAPPRVTFLFWWPCWPAFDRRNYSGWSTNRIYWVDHLCKWRLRTAIFSALYFYFKIRY